MRYIFSFIIALNFSVFLISAQPLSLIPLPSEVKPGTGTYTLTAATRIVLKDDSDELKKVCDIFLDLINPSTGFNITYAETSNLPIVVALDSLIAHPEGYHLKVTQRDITIQAQTPTGIFYAFQTLRQLLPPVIESRTMTNRRWTIPVIEINDAPRFSYRGLMLDVARHFYPVNDVKHFIDLMAMHKFNYLHLHLTDDQGWRIEMPAFPRLQNISAWRRETMVGHLNEEPRRYDGVRHGGFYTQAELKELVQYAADRFITIVPEIEMPGHVTALLAAYPDLGSGGSSYEVARDWGSFSNMLSPREDNFILLERILTELMRIFPGKYIHIGGREVPKEQWQKNEFCRNTKIQNGLRNDEQLQTWFMRRIAKFIQSHGREVIGWDEMIDGGEIAGATVMSWRNEKSGMDAIRKGNNVIMSQHDYCHFDYYQGTNRNEEPLAQGNYLPLSKVYMYEPVPKELTEPQQQSIIGTQGNLWTEYIPNIRHAEYMLYPRACALAETAWTQADKKSYPLFLNRLREHSKRLETLNVNYARNFLIR